MKESIFSFFRGPISNPVPSATCNIIQLHKYITTDKRLEEMTDRLRAIPPEDKKGRAKVKTWLPYITPLAVVRRRCDAGMITPSGLLVLDIDDMESNEAACQLRDSLFSDTVLKPDLVNVSPSGLGVKALVPYCVSPFEPLVQTVNMAYLTYWDYVERKYCGMFQMKVDRCGDISRACFLCHDAGAMIRV